MADWGLGLIATLQQHGSPALDVLFRLASILSEREAQLIFVALIYWSLGTRAALRLLLLLLASTLLNQGLKEIIRLPRPFAFDASLQRYPAEGYGLPSGAARPGCWPRSSSSLSASRASTWASTSLWTWRPAGWSVGSSSPSPGYAGPGRHPPGIGKRRAPAACALPAC